MNGQRIDNSVRSQ